jgi:hypothetical protein
MRKSLPESSQPSTFENVALAPLADIEAAPTPGRWV